MKSKLSKDKYPQADPKLYLRFKYADEQEVDPVFAGRLAALAEYMSKQTCTLMVIDIVSGYRTTEKQVRFYKASGGKCLNGGWEGGNGKAARPGTSFHEFRLAIDTCSRWLKKLDKLAATAEQKTLIRFGLFKPMTKGNKKTVLEDWHIQPIETAGALDREMWAPEVVPALTRNLKLNDRGEDVKLLQTQLNKLGHKLVIDGHYGAKTGDAVRSFQKSMGLASDGVVGQKTWERLFD